MKIKPSLLSFLLGIVLIIGIFLGRFFSAFQQPETPSLPLPTNEVNESVAENPSKLKLNKLIDYIETEYVDKVNSDSIVDLTVNGILNKLDPHSTYIPKADIQATTETMSGKFVGVGISFYIYKDTIAVINTIEGSDAQNKGIIFGDRILKADNDTLFGKKITSEKIRDFFKGKINSQVNLSVYRKKNDSLFTLPIIRKFIPIKSVDCYYAINDTLGYVRINRFAESTHKEFVSALKKLISNGITNLILDLRNNAGGYLKAGIEIADELLPKDKMILFTKNNRKEVEEIYASDGGIFENNPVFVLVNEHTASASEIVAGALQDNDRGVIIGRRTFGKGLVQSEMPLPDGSAIRLTTARYYTPTGRSIQKPYKHRVRLDKQINKNTIADSLKFTTPKGKIVYGGGGIYPDEYIATDIQNENYLTYEVLNSGVCDYFLFEYLDVKPPSSPTAVTKPRSCKILDKLWNTSAPQRNASLNVGAPTGKIMNSWKAIGASE